MKKILSFLLALLLLLSISGCAPDIGSLDTQPQLTTTVPETTAPAAETEKVVIPYLIGSHIDELPQTDDYIVEEIGQEHSEYPIGTILMQDPEGGAWVDKGTVVHVITSLDQAEGSEQSPETEPVYWEPSNQDQDNPERPSQDPIESQPEQPTQPKPTEPKPTDPPATEPEPYLDPNGSYTTKNDVALYIHLYGRLPKNFITKNQADDMYGKTSGLNKYGKCIGGDRFYNKEGLLPSGYTYYECDIDTLYSSKRGAKRLVFTYSGRIYYTDDHYKSFTRLY